MFAKILRIKLDSRKWHQQKSANLISLNSVESINSCDKSSLFFALCHRGQNLSPAIGLGIDSRNREGTEFGTEKEPSLEPRRNRV
jgi:hypothetical protein